MKEIHPKLSPSEDLAYILGVLKGDGYTTNPRGTGNYIIGLRSTSLTFNKSFEKSLKQLGLHPHTMKHQPSKSHWGHKVMYQTVAHSKVFYGWYRALTLEEIEDILIVHKLELLFLRGFYEAEGSLKKRGDLSISNSNQDLLKLVKDLMFKIGVECWVNGPYKWGTNRKPMYLIQIGQRKARRLIHLIKPCIRNQFQEHKNLGIKRARWTKNELKILRSGLPLNELMQKLKNRTNRAIKTKRRRLEEF